MVRERAVDDAIRQCAVLGPEHLAHIDVLDRMLIAVEAEITADRVEVRLAQGIVQGVAVVDLASDFGKRAAEQARGIVALAGVQRGAALVTVLEGLDEVPVGGIVQIGAPLRAVAHAQGCIPRRAENAFVE